MKHSRYDDDLWRWYHHVLAWIATTVALAGVLYFCGAALWLSWKAVFG